MIGSSVFIRPPVAEEAAFSSAWFNKTPLFGNAILFLGNQSAHSAP
jgi:hypothetical protein